MRDSNRDGAQVAAVARPVVRLAELGDAGKVQALIDVRRETDEATGSDSKGSDLDNPSRRLWLALVDEQAVGMTSVQQRQLRLGQQEHRVAYWTGLFIDPTYRGPFVYPQLLLGMFNGLRNAGIHYLYAAVRRQPIAEAHLKVGFQKIGDLSVRAKPLRPARLYAKYRGLVRRDGSPRLLRLLCHLPDSLAYVAIQLQGPRRTWSVTEIPWTAPELTEVAALYAAENGEYMTQPWTVELLRTRSPAGTPLIACIGLRHQEQLQAAAIVRVVDRPEGIRAAIIMDVIHHRAVAGAAAAALAAAESFALHADCDVVLYLDGLPALDSRLVSRRGYRKSPERYSLLVWVDRGAESAVFPRQLSSWRFAFGDHDTF